MLGLLTKAPIFLVRALSDSTGSEGEALRLPSSLLPSPLCDRPSSPPLGEQRWESLIESSPGIVFSSFQIGALYREVGYNFSAF